MTSSELTGGAGFTYEDAVAARYLAAMLEGTTAPALGGRVVERVAQQQASFGEPLDDVIVDADSPGGGSAMRLSLQVKRSLTISAAETNRDFREVIQRSWETLQKPNFREHVDRVGVAAGSIAEVTARAFMTVCDWARASDTALSFMQRFAAGGSASAAHIAIADAVRKVARNAARPLSDDDLYRLLSHLVLIRFDFLHVGSTHEAEAIASLQHGLAPDRVARAGELWNSLRQLARDGAGHSAMHTRASLVRALAGWRFLGAPALVGDMRVLREQTRLWLGNQEDSIAGVHLSRAALYQQLRTQIANHRLTLIKGLPGTGKTILLRDLVRELAATGTTLFLGTKQLSGRSWPQYARAIGLAATSIESLLVEVAATGHATLLIDGLDRIGSDQRGIVTDLFGELLTNPAFSDWRVVATARDAGIEPLRNWVPPALLATGGVGYVDVGDLTNEEARSLAGELPALRPLLLHANERVRTLTCRPFFAAVLARDLARTGSPSAFVPQSEVDLVEAWWTRGGYNAGADATLARQCGLIELAEHGAADLGRTIRIRDLSSSTRQVLQALEEDGLIQSVRRGHTVQFSHDIFFEWSFLHLLLDKAQDWISALTAAGEPPALARAVELFSQATYAESGPWSHELHALEHAGVRPQWLRAWLVAPVFNPHFTEHADSFANELIANEHQLFGRLLVWIQAEKTTPNPSVLSGALGNDLDAAARIRVADALSWPSDFAAWSRLLVWAMDQIDSVPAPLLGDLVALFETWQVAMTDVANAVSARIVAQCVAWLNALEDDRASRYAFNRADDRIENDPAPPPQMSTELEARLRALVLRAARAYPDVVDAYLTKVEAISRWPDGAFREVMAYAPVLSETHPRQLARVARRMFLDELPNDTAARWAREEGEQFRRRTEILAMPPERRSRSETLALATAPVLRSSFSSHDWERLSVGGNYRGYFPASPVREPFSSLFTRDPATALLLIRDLTNHAATAWRQLHRLCPESLTPVPLQLAFPWGRQEFWGDDRHYLWFRGHGGPQVIECALMALERWAIAQIDAKRPLDGLLQELLQGHASLAVLGVAVHLALRAQHASPATLALVQSQRLWRLDLQRWVQESSLQSSELIGFSPRPIDAIHRQAVADSNGLLSRRRELRDLVPLFVLGGSGALRDACRKALDEFPHKLEFAYQEEAQRPEHVAELRRTAELWAELGHAENYAAEPIPGRDDAIRISMSSARHEAPDVQAVRQRHIQIEREMALWLWVDRCFSSRNWAPGFSVDEAVARAKELVAARVPRQPIPHMPDVGPTEGAIAGTAAAVICFADAHAHKAWANATIDSIYARPDTESGDTFSESVIPWHPKIFVAHALAARIKSGHQHPKDREALYHLIAHPLDVVSLAAVAGVAACWVHDPQFAWCGINLGLRLAQHVHRHDMVRLDAAGRERAEAERRAVALTAALGEYRGSTPLPPWIRPRPSWACALPGDEDVPAAGMDDDGWQATDDVWASRYAAKVLQHVPVALVMAGDCRACYVDTVEAYLRWTLDTINPAWRTAGRRARDRGNGSLYEWESQLGQMAAGVVPYLPAEEVMRRWLRPILAQPDDVAMRLLTPFTTSLVCGEVLDTSTIRDDTLCLLRVVLDRTLEHRDLRRSPYSDGRIGGIDLPELIKALLFVVVEHAPGAARFANGAWGDIDRVMPLIDRMVRAAGWHPYVARQYVTLCERAGAAYPATTFADQMLAQIVGGCLPATWKGTSLPATIAALVQAHADRQHPLPAPLARKLLRVLDALVDLGDRRSAALQQSESFRGVRLVA